MFSHTQLDDFKATLLAQKQESESTLEGTEQAAEIVKLDQSSVGRLSRMDALQAQAMAKANKARAQQRVVQINRALTRLETEDFGYCEACDEPISLARLQYDPSARYCLDCADKK